MATDLESASSPNASAQRQLYQRPAFWLSLSGLVALMLVIIFFDSWKEWSGQKGALVPAAPKPIAEEKTVVALGWIDQGMVEEGKPFRLWVSFENRSDLAAENLRFLTFQTPGFTPGFFKIRPKIGPESPPMDCWVGGGPACRPRGTGVPPLLGLPTKLEKGKSVTVFAVLVPRTGDRQFGASGVFTWRDQGGEHEGAVVVPAIPVASEAEQLLFSLGKVILLLKDLLVPAALAYLGWYLQHRDNVQKDKQDREKGQREAKERKQTEFREIWSLMLPKSHANAEQHYMPVVASIEFLLNKAGVIQPNSRDEQWQELLWALLRFLRRMQHLAQGIGGFYFRSREGEWLARQCWNRFYSLSRDQLGPADRDRGVSALQPNENLASFLDKLAGRPADPSLGSWARTIFDPAARDVAQALARLDTRLREWVAEEGLQRSLPLLKLLRLVVEYEMNRTYELWYGAGTEMKLEEEKFQCALLGLEPELKELQERAKAYLEKEKSPKQ